MSRHSVAGSGLTNVVVSIITALGLEQLTRTPQAGVCPARRERRDGAQWGRRGRATSRGLPRSYR
jgi:hypothetical protein